MAQTLAPIDITLPDGQQVRISISLVVERITGAVIPIPPPMPVPVPVPVPVPTTPQTYYLSPAGDDANPGTQAAPWKTLRKAARTLRAGDTAVFGDGTYHVLDGSDVEGRHNIVISSQGAPDAWVTYKAANRGKAIIDCDMVSQAIMLRNQYAVPYPQYVRFDGFDIGNSDYRGVCVDGGRFIRFANCTFHDHREEAFFVFREASDITVEYCRFYRNHENSIDTVGATRLIVDHCRFEGGEWTYPCFVQFKGMARDCIVRYCTFDTVRPSEANLWKGAVNLGGSAACYNGLCHDNLFRDVAGVAIRFCQADGSAAWNNMVYRTTPTTMPAIIIDDPGQGGLPTVNATVCNNLVYDVNGVPVAWQNRQPGGVEGLRVEGNLWDGRDPKCVNVANGNYRPSAGSPAIDAGVGGQPGARCLGGVLRPQGAGVDVGCYEYGG